MLEGYKQNDVSPTRPDTGSGMDSRIQIRPGTPSPQGSFLSGAPLGLPSEVLREARVRLSRAAIVVFVWCLMLGVAWALQVMSDIVEWRVGRIVLATLLAVLVSSVVVLALSRIKRMPDLLLLILGLGYGGALSLIGAFIHVVHETDRFGQVTPFGIYVLLITIFPILFSCPPRLTMVIVAIYSGAVLLGVWCAGLALDLDLGGSVYLDIGTALLVCAAGAYVLSRLMYQIQTKFERERRLGSYHLEEKIGEGGMGEVWRANHRVLVRPAAVKLIRPEALAGDRESRSATIDRFFREAQATAFLESPHTVRIFDFGITDDQTLYFTMELLDGINLGTLVCEAGPMPPERVQVILLQVCESLSEAHELGLVHRDVKPANIMLCRKGRRLDLVKVLDFGLVTPKDMPSAHPARLTIDYEIMGTPAFMGPEAYNGGSFDARSDLYSVGCLAFWLLTGREVFDESSPVAQAASHLREVVRTPSSLGVPVPGDLEAIVMSCLAKDPADRPQTADELALRLSECRFTTHWTEERAAEWWEEHAPLPTLDDSSTNIVSLPTTVDQRRT